MALCDSNGLSIVSIGQKREPRLKTNVLKQKQKRVVPKYYCVVYKNHSCMMDNQNRAKKMTTA
jgi:hypothetical protein